MQLHSLKSALGPALGRPCAILDFDLRSSAVSRGPRPPSYRSTGCCVCLVRQRNVIRDSRLAARSSVKGPEKPITQRRLSEWERSTEEDRRQVADLQAAFKEADKDGNGVIDRDELRLLLSEGSSKLAPVTLHWLSEAGISDIMDSVSSEETQRGINFEHFASLARAGALLDGKFSEYRRVFQGVDVSGNGTLSASEIREVFAELGNPLSDTKLWKIFEKYDRDGSGQIDFGEFLAMFRDELLDLHEILRYLEMHPRTGADGPEKPAQAKLGQVTVIFSEAELDSILEEHADRLVVLEASLTWCRPCKGFEKVFKKFAEAFSETLFLKFYGNSNENCKHLIEQRLEVPLTPTFTFFRKGAPLAHVTGANRGRLYDGILELLLPHENPLDKLNPFQQQVWRSKLGLG